MKLSEVERKIKLWNIDNPDVRIYMDKLPSGWRIGLENKVWGRFRSMGAKSLDEVAAFVEGINTMGYLCMCYPDDELMPRRGRPNIEKMAKIIKEEKAWRKKYHWDKPSKNILYTRGG